jgi:hypothetical protein
MLRPFSKGLIDPTFGKALLAANALANSKA